MEMPKYEASIDIQWKMIVGAASYELARELVIETVNSLLNDVRYQEISDESIDIDIREI